MVSFTTRGPANAIPADLVGFHHGDLEAALGQLHRRGDAGETAADDGHVHGHAALQRRVVALEVERGRVVGRPALGAGYDGLLDRDHPRSLESAAPPLGVAGTPRPVAPVNPEK